MASITVSGIDVGNVNEGSRLSYPTGLTATFDNIREVILNSYPNADLFKTIFTFNLSVSGTAEGADFNASNLIVSYFVRLDGSVSLPQVGTINDSAIEGDETFSLQPVLNDLSIDLEDGRRIRLNPSQIEALFANAGGLTVNVGAITGTLIDNDFPPNQPPTAVNFINTTPDLDENSDTTSRIKVADVTITDDGQGTNNLSLSGSDAGAFELDGTTLYLKAGTTLDYEAKTSYSVTVNVDDPAVGNTPDLSKTFTLQVNDLVENTAPTDLSLSSTTVNENVAVGTTVGNFSTTDAEGGSFTYALVSGTGSTDNASFTIDGDQLKINTSPDFETKSSYSIRVKTTDASGLSYEEAFTIGINDLPENRTPTAVNDSVNAYRGVPTTIAASTLLANDTDPDAGTTLQITGVSNATNGTVSLNSSGNVVFTATNTGNASFQYTISDGSLTSTATVAVSVGLSLNGGNGIDILKGSDRDDLINGNGGADALYGNKGNDTLNGGSSLDLLVGGEGNDLLNGGDSADALYGGKGNDTLTGGNGRDIFAFTAGDGSDIITDFADGSDTIGLVGLRFRQVTISASGSSTVIKYGSETLATLTGVNSTLITAADFVTI
jgi:Ca2+-binding RTX toxin-like protein